MGCGRWEGKGRDGSCDETWGHWMGRWVDTPVGHTGREMDGRRWDQTGRHTSGRMRQTDSGGWGATAHLGRAPESGASGLRSRKRGEAGEQGTDRL